MTGLRRLDGAEERMDAPGADPEALDQALGHVAAVNRWLGGRRALLRHVPPLLPPGPARVLDVGTGSADLPVALARRLARDPRRFAGARITAVDLHARTIAAARRRIASTRTDDGAPPIQLARADGLRLPFADASFDVALLSMTLHHMEGAAQVGILRELARVARDGHVVVAELERARAHYLGARFLSATLWRRNPITRHDGPLSVLRAFTADELLDLARRAGLRDGQVARHPFYRLVMWARA